MTGLGFMAEKHLRILLSGMIASVPGQGGATWAVLQYFLGLRQLGHEVHFVEVIPVDSIHPAGVALYDSVNAGYFRRVIERYELGGAATLVHSGTKETVGRTYDELCRLAGRCDILLNLSGLLQDHELTGRIPLRVYVDLDPGFTQLWHLQEDLDVGLDGHNRFVTIGMTIGAPDCLVPAGDFDWVKTLQPIVLDQWPVAQQHTRRALTTVANWRGYGSVEFQGRLYGQKAHSLRPFFKLPQRTDKTMALALAIHAGEHSDLALLNRHGWRLLDPDQVAGTPDAFRTFVQESWAEFGIAKSGYVTANCGWFSDRSICYLASGRPVLAQETGFSKFLPSGEGLLSFKVEDDVLSCIDQLHRDYSKHCRAARRIAEEHFDATRVLRRLLQRTGAAP